MLLSDELLIPCGHDRFCAPSLLEIAFCIRGAGDGVPTLNFFLGLPFELVQNLQLFAGSMGTVAGVSGHTMRSLVSVLPPRLNVRRLCFWFLGGHMCC